MRSQAHRTEGEASSRAAPAAILLIEDNPGDVGLVRKALEQHGVEAELLVLDDGEQAIRFIEQLDMQPSLCPDLIILDLNLPKKSGREVMEAMRRSHWCRHVPLIVLSSSDVQRDREDAQRFGANEYLCKPIRLDEFLALGAVFKRSLPER